MSNIFTDKPASSVFGVIDSTIADGTKVYTFAFTSKLNDSAATHTTTSFNIILTNPCDATTIGDPNPTFSLVNTALSPSATSLTWIDFTNSYAGPSLVTCGGYTYTLTGYTGSFLTFNAATHSISLLSILSTDNIGSPYTTVKLEGCLTNYPSVTCCSKPVSIIISECAISTYLLTSGQISIANSSPITYTPGKAAITITLPKFTQSPLCGFAVTNTCYLSASPAACPTWIATT